ncbi:MAG: class I lanthipeptide [Prevotellaceae bacterium]|jgi:hypothetical protein|nr:class I lanthipeptide [Prevotellaceae bacterium]
MKKLFLNKETITQLDRNERVRLMGGITQNEYGCPHYTDNPDEYLPPSAADTGCGTGTYTVTCPQQTVGWVCLPPTAWELCASETPGNCEEKPVTEHMCAFEDSILECPE